MGKKIKISAFGVVNVRGVDISGQGNPPEIELDVEAGHEYVLVTIRDRPDYLGIWVPIKRLVKALRKAGVIE